MKVDNPRIRVLFVEAELVSVDELPSATPNEVEE